MEGPINISNVSSTYDRRFCGANSVDDSNGKKHISICFCNVCLLKAEENYRGILNYDTTDISKTCLCYTKNHCLNSCNSDSSTLGIVKLSKHSWHLNV